MLILCVKLGVEGHIGNGKLKLPIQINLYSQKCKIVFLNDKEIRNEIDKRIRK